LTRLPTSALSMKTARFWMFQIMHLLDKSNEIFAKHGKVFGQYLAEYARNGEVHITPSFIMLSKPMEDGTYVFWLNGKLKEALTYLKTNNIYFERGLKGDKNMRLLKLKQLRRLT
jgi:hypothetical protein